MPSKNEIYQNRILEVVQDDLYQEIDGFYYYNTPKGCLAASALRIIADELDKRNKDWNEIIDQYHKNEKINV